MGPDTEPTPAAEMTAVQVPGELLAVTAHSAGVGPEGGTGTCSDANEPDAPDAPGIYPIVGDGPGTKEDDN